MMQPHPLLVNGSPTKRQGKVFQTPVSVHEGDKLSEKIMGFHAKWDYR